MTTPRGARPSVQKLTPKQRVLKARPTAVCDMTGGGGWAIWMPSKQNYIGVGRISLPCDSPAKAWADAAERLK